MLRQCKFLNKAVAADGAKMLSCLFLQFLSTVMLKHLMFSWSGATEVSSTMNSNIRNNQTILLISGCFSSLSVNQCNVN